MYPLIGSLGPSELLIILAIVVLLFGAAKLPELARGSGRALRIFKAETQGLHDDDESSSSAQTQSADTPELKSNEANPVSDPLTQPRRDDTTA